VELFSAEKLIETYDACNIDRLFVVGDLHGCYQEFLYKLHEVNFNFNRDLVVSVGDLVDRGENSIQCLELIKKPWFKAIRGNHEQMCLEATIAPEMESFHCKHGGQWLYDLSKENRLDVINLCLNLPIVLEITYNSKKYGFVHADIKHNNWNDFKKSILMNDYMSNQGQSTLQNALWGRARISDKSNLNNYQFVSGIDAIFLGHTVVKRATQLHNCFYIDTGAVFNGCLTLIQL
jgi:serine/threonine protein phosphatase 1